MTPQKGVEQALGAAGETVSARTSTMTPKGVEQSTVNSTGMPPWNALTMTPKALSSPR